MMLSLKGLQSSSRGTRLVWHKNVLIVLPNYRSYKVQLFDCILIPYMAKHPQGKTFTVFHSTTNLFFQIMALLIGKISLLKCYSRSFTTNSHFPLKMQKFSPVDVFPYMVYRFGIFAGMSSQYNIPGNTVLSDTYVHIRM